MFTLNNRFIDSTIHINVGLRQCSYAFLKLRCWFPDGGICQRPAAVPKHWSSTPRTLHLTQVIHGHPVYTWHISKWSAACCRDGLWDPDFFLAYAQRGKGALHSLLALIGSDLLSFLQSVVLCCFFLSVSQEKLGLAQEKEVLLEDCHFTPQAQRSAWEWPRWPLFSTETTPSISTDTVKVCIYVFLRYFSSFVLDSVTDL